MSNSWISAEKVSKTLGRLWHENKTSETYLIFHCERPNKACVKRIQVALIGDFHYKLAIYTIPRDLIGKDIHQDQLKLPQTAEFRWKRECAEFISKQKPTSSWFYYHNPKPLPPRPRPNDPVVWGAVEVKDPRTRCAAADCTRKTEFKLMLKLISGVSGSKTKHLNFCNPCVGKLHSGQTLVYGSGYNTHIIESDLPPIDPEKQELADLIKSEDVETSDDIILDEDGYPV